MQECIKINTEDENKKGISMHESFLSVANSNASVIIQSNKALPVKFCDSFCLNLPAVDDLSSLAVFRHPVK